MIFNSRDIIPKAAFLGALDAYKPTFDAFRETAKCLFEVLAEGKSYTRKPPFALRLRSSADSAWLSASPNWSKHHHRILFDWMRIEYIVERHVEVNGQPAFQSHRGIYNAGGDGLMYLVLLDFEETLEHEHPDIECVLIGDLDHRWNGIGKWVS